MGPFNHLIVEYPLPEVIVVKISSPATLNALDSTILEELDCFASTLVSELESGKDIRAAVITGEGKAFVAGANIAQMAGFTSSQALEFGKKGALVFRIIEDLKIPVIAAVNGFALGGGCELALACDIRIAGEKASFGQPEVGLGIIPGFSGTYRLPKIVGQGIAKDLIYTGRRIDAQEALRIGLVSRVVEQDTLLDQAISLAQSISRNAPIAVALAKESVNKNYDMPRTEALEFENKLFAECFKTQDQKDGMTAFLEKRKPAFNNR